MMKPQNLKKDAAYVYSAYALRYLSVIVLIPYYGRVLGPASYGTVLTAMSLMALVWIVVNFGFSSTGSRSLASSADSASQAQIVSRQLSARLILAPIGALIGVLGTVLSPALRSDPWFGVVATLLGFMNSMNLGWFYQGLRRFRLSLIFEAMAYPLNVAFIFMFVRNSGDGINALLSVLASTCISAACAYAVAVRIVRPAALSIRGGIAEIKAASTIFLQGVNAMLMTSGSTYLLSVLSTPEQVGYFGSVEKLISFALAFLQPAAQVLMPTITHRSKHIPGEEHQLIRKGIAFEMGYGICACVGGLILAPYIIPLAFGVRFFAFDRDHAHHGLCLAVCRVYTCGRLLRDPAQEKRALAGHRLRCRQCVQHCDDHRPRGQVRGHGSLCFPSRRRMRHRLRPRLPGIPGETAQCAPLGAPIIT